jgi:hypothetical protein
MVKKQWIDKVINHLNEIRLGQIFKDRKACNDLVQRTEARVRDVALE